MKPKLEQIWPEYEWSDGNNRWVKCFEVYIVDDVGKIGVLGKEKNNVIGEIMWALVCSPAYLDNPSDEFSTIALEKAFVQDSYDEELFRNELESKINTIGKQSIDNMFKKLGAFLIVEE